MIGNDQIKFDILEFTIMGTQKRDRDAGNRAKAVWRAFRYKNGRQFALDIGVEPVTWNTYENGAPVSTSTWLKIARKCPGVKHDWLKYGDWGDTAPSLRRLLSDALMASESERGAGKRPRRTSRAKSRQVP